MTASKQRPARNRRTPTKAKPATVPKPEATPEPKRPPKAPPWQPPSPQLMESITDVLRELPHKHVAALRDALEHRPDAMREDLRCFGQVANVDSEIDRDTGLAINRIFELLPLFTPIYVQALKKQLEAHAGPGKVIDPASITQHRGLAERPSWPTPERADLTGYPEWFHPTRLASWREQHGADGIDRLIVAVFVEGEDRGLGEAIADFPVVGNRGTAEFVSEYIEQTAGELRRWFSPSVGFVVDGINGGRMPHEQFTPTLPIVGGPIEDPEAEKGAKAS